jgi:hypothetical protein
MREINKLCNLDRYKHICYTKSSSFHNILILKFIQYSLHFFFSKFTWTNSKDQNKSSQHHTPIFEFVCFETHAHTYIYILHKQYLKLFIPCNQSIIFCWDKNHPQFNTHCHFIGYHFQLEIFLFRENQITFSIESIIPFSGAQRNINHQ